VEKPEGRDPCETYLSVNGRIILKCILKEEGERL
jgi:hypothetical protein